MTERLHTERRPLLPEREELFCAAERELQFPADVYRLEERNEALPQELKAVTMLDVTKGPGAHYGAKNVFVPIIHFLESTSDRLRNQISPKTTIFLDGSTGNGFVAGKNAADKLGYEFVAVMPDGLPESRYVHPDGRKVEIIKTHKGEYAQGMPKQIQALVDQNRQRIREGKKIYVPLNHAGAMGDITVEAMSELGRQLLAHLGDFDEPVRVVVSMGNGASLCAVGEYVKTHSNNAKVVATESFAYGGGYDRFAQRRGLPSYKELFGIDPGHSDLMAQFSAFGTNAPIGIEMPLQTRAINSDLIDEYVLFTDDQILQAYRQLHPKEDQVNNVLQLPNYSTLPRTLYETYGNSTLANISVASRFTNNGEHVVAMAYDSRKNY